MVKTIREIEVERVEELLADPKLKDWPRYVLTKYLMSLYPSPINTKITQPWASNKSQISDLHDISDSLTDILHQLLGRKN